MANPWFKFYATDYLKEVKFLGVDANKRSCFVTLLCYASVEEGRVNTKYLTNEMLKIEAGVKMGGDAWTETGDVYAWLVERDMGYMEGEFFVFKSWEKRQSMYATDAERSKKYRTKQKNEEERDDAVTIVTLDKNRIDKNRREEKNTASLSYLEEIPEPDLKEFSERFEASGRQIRSKAEELVNYCRAKGKTYRDYKAFLLNALKRDFSERRKPDRPPPEQKQEMTPEELQHLESISKELAARKRV